MDQSYRYGTVWPAPLLMKELVLAPLLGLCSGYGYVVYVADMMWSDHKSVGWYNTVDAVDIAKMS